MCDDNTFGTACLSPEPMIFEKDGQEYYGIDSAYGSMVKNFTPPLLLPRVRMDETGELVVTLKNQLSGVAVGSLEVVLEDAEGTVYDILTTGFETTPDSTDRGFIFSWIAPSYRTDGTAAATAIVDGDIDLTDNQGTGMVRVR